MSTPDNSSAPPAPSEPKSEYSRLARAESVLSVRTSRIVLVLEQCMDSQNHQAVLRTAEALGIQHVWLVELPQEIKLRRKPEFSHTITKGCTSWLSFRRFSSVRDCIKALKEESFTIWATDLSPTAVVLTPEHTPDGKEFPEKLAIVIGRESDGVSEEMLSAADCRVFLPMYGFTGSFNLSVATALTLQTAFLLCPNARGNLSSAEKSDIRKAWFPFLAPGPMTQQKFAFWLEEPEKIEKLADLRRDSGRGTAMIPPYIRKREAEIGLERERQAKIAKHSAEDDVTTSNP